MTKLFFLLRALTSKQVSALKLKVKSNSKVNRTFQSRVTAAYVTDPFDIHCYWACTVDSYLL